MSLLALALLSATSPADAAVYGGNPSVKLKVDRPPHDLTAAEVNLAKVRVHNCSGGGYTDYTIAETVDLVTEYTLPISAGTYCNLTVFWDSAMTIESNAFVLEYDHASTAVALTGTVQTVALTPFTVVLGAIYGGNPSLIVIIE
ncbi:MAG: hypothetical protein Q8P41_21650 [Pseudomonadota bacterium]|nr:hypothetical protein [Pseudomonadota bacterium]